jgi:hypothetical protein
MAFAFLYCCNQTTTNTNQIFDSVLSEIVRLSLSKPFESSFDKLRTTVFFNV